MNRLGEIIQSMSQIPGAVATALCRRASVNKHSRAASMQGGGYKIYEMADGF
jgi:hypothetical protein